MHQNHFEKHSVTSSLGSIETYCVNDLQFGRVLLVVPVPVVDPLPEQLDGRLGPVDLLGWHVQIVHEHDAPLPHRRAIHTLATPVKKIQTGTINVTINANGKKLSVLWYKKICSSITIFFDLVLYQTGHIYLYLFAHSIASQ